MPGGNPEAEIPPVADQPSLAKEFVERRREGRGEEPLLNPLTTSLGQDGQEVSLRIFVQARHRVKEDPQVTLEPVRARGRPTIGLDLERRLGVRKPAGRRL